MNPPPNTEISPWRTILPRVGVATSRRGLKVRDVFLPELHPLGQWPATGRGESGGQGPVRAELALRIYRPDHKPRNPSSSVRIQINDPWMEGRLIYEDDQGGMYLPWPLLEERDGHRRYRIDRNTVLIKILPQWREAWLPVSQERWIGVLISKTEELLEDRRSKITVDAEQRGKRFQQVHERMKTINPEEAAKQLKTFDENERGYTRIAAAIEAGDYDALEAAGDRGMAMVGRSRLALQEELAGLSAAERAAPAYGFESDPMQFWMPRRTPKRPSLLLSPEDRNALPVLAPNPDFFRRDLPSGELQAMTIVNGLWKEFSDRMEEELDWAVLIGMVR